MTKKIGSPFIAALPVQDSSFVETFFALNHLGMFYGTDEHNQRQDYLPTILEALNERISVPIAKWSADPKTCFFKPYFNRTEAMNGFMNGFLTPLCGILAGFGVLGVWSAHPAAIIALFCGPALIELVAGIVGLGQAFWHQMKAFCYQSASEQNEAAAYFLDAVTRFALVVPLAVVSFASVPFELVRFLTRGISTLMACMPVSEEVEKDDAELINGSNSYEKNDESKDYGSTNTL
jgi:hypothetical protein